MAEWPSPDTLIAGRYRLGELLHATPNEALYRARTEWDGAVLLSLYAAPHAGTPLGQRARQIWQRHARSLLQLQHPHLLPVRDLIGESAGAGETLGLVFEPRRASTLRERLADGPLRTSLLQTLTVALFEGLSAAHRGALLHTQLSPEAVWFDEQQRPLLAEFGLGRRTAQELREDWPPDPRYAAPELLAGGPYTPQTDLYALAATLLEAVTGTALPPATARQQGVRLPAWPTGVPTGAAHALEACLCLDPAARAVSAAEVLEMLRRAPVEPVGGTPVSQSAEAAVAPLAGPVDVPAQPTPMPPTVAAHRSGFPWWTLAVIGVAALGVYKLEFEPRHSASTVVTESTTAASASDAAAEQAATAAAPEPRGGEETFAESCAGCHGAFGEGGVGPALSEARDWTSEQFLRAVREGQAPDRELAPMMPRFSATQLSDVEAQNVHTFLSSLLPDTTPIPSETPSEPEVAAVPAAPPPPPEATPVEALPPSEDPITDEEVASFVDGYLAAGSGDDLASAMVLYADRVDYFDRGVQARDVLQKDKAGYFKRWPQRAYRRVSDIQTLSEGANDRLVRFNYSYDLTRPGKQLTGQAYTDLRLIKTGGKLFITSENGKIFKELQHSVTTEVPAPTESANTLSETPDFSTASEDRAASADSRQGAPKFLSWSFGGCVDDVSGVSGATLSLGRLQHCALVIETLPNGAVPAQAVFNYELEYNEAGEVRKFAINAPDVWPSQTSGPLETTFRQEGVTLIFTVPLTVRERLDRTYTQINTIGKVTFDNGSEKNIYVRIPID
ncbi:serine/threonine protein kinase [Deinococcus taklimakanensis]|uniref:Serine/threonine protein kinase n=1 Tax=Deinococcus taklimakanensis TaxID=536443 RepID=A0ABW5P330_9DEIO